MIETLLFILSLVGAPTPAVTPGVAKLAAPQAQVAALEKMALGALARVEKQRGQKLSKPLKMGVKNKEEVTVFVKARLEEEYGDKRVAAEGKLLELQGLLPPELDYGGFIASLLAEQVAGFYDHTRQELHIAAWLPVLMQEPVMAHEIFHAIQDQEWGGGKLLDSKKYSHDAIIAHASLLEGDATIVMLNYQQSLGGSTVDVTESPATVKMVAMALPMQMASPQFPVMAVAPDYLKQSLIFPYQQGLLFVSALRQSGLGWDKIRDVYRKPPNSTEQILHPDRYLKRDEPSPVTVAPRPGYARDWESVAGEFHMRQLLLAHLPLTDAIEAATGWDGDLTYVETKGDEAVAVTVSTWDSENDAKEYAAALSKAHGMRTKSPVHLKTRLAGTTLMFAFAKTPEVAAAAIDFAKKSTKIERR